MSANRTSNLTVLSVERQLSSCIMEDSSSTITYCIRTHEKATNSARVGWLRYTSDSIQHNHYTVIPRLVSRPANGVFRSQVLRHGIRCLNL